MSTMPRSLSTYGPGTREYDEYSAYLLNEAAQGRMPEGPGIPAAPTGPYPDWSPGWQGKYAPQIQAGADLQAGAYPTLGGPNVRSRATLASPERDRRGPGYGTDPGLPPPPPPSGGTAPPPPLTSPPPAATRPNLRPDANGIIQVPGIGPIPKADIDSAGGWGKWVAGHIASGAAYDQSALAAAGLMPGQFSSQTKQLLNALREQGVNLPDPGDLTDYDVQELLKASGAPAMPSGTGYSSQGWLNWVALAAGLVGTALTGGAAAGVLAPIWGSVGVGASAAGGALGAAGGGTGGVGTGGTDPWATILGTGLGALGGALGAQQGQLPGYVEDDLRYWMGRRRDQEQQATAEYSGTFDPETGQFIPGTRQRAAAAYEGMVAEPGYNEGERENIYWGDEDRENLFLRPEEQQGLFLTPKEKAGMSYQPWEEEGLRFADWEAQGLRFTPEEQEWARYTPEESQGLRYTSDEAAGLQIGRAHV